jgi:hypothetical protein
LESDFSETTFRKTNMACLFSGKWFQENHFPNFPVFVCD